MTQLLEFEHTGYIDHCNCFYLAIDILRSPAFEDSLAHSSAIFSWLYLIRSIACELEPAAEPKLMYLVRNLSKSPNTFVHPCSISSNCVSSWIQGFVSGLVSGLILVSLYDNV